MSDSRLSAFSVEEKSGSPATVKTLQPTANPAIASVEFMLILIGLGVIPDLGHIIMAYATPSMQKTSAFHRGNPEQFFTSRIRYTYFYHDFSDLAEADQHCIWGRPEEVKKTIEDVIKKSVNDENLLRTKFLFTRSIDGEDHRGPGFIPSGTLFERALYVGDFLNENESNETMVGMLERYIIKYCGKDEFKRQITRAREVIAQESAMKLSMAAEGIKALHKVWDVLENADIKKLTSNVQLKIALGEFESQLKKPGNESILHEVETLYDRDYVKFGGYNSLKNNFAKNLIIGKVQLRCLSVCELQLCYSGLYGSLNVPDAKLTAKRIDVRQALGVLSTGVTYSLGTNCHLDIFGMVESAASSRVGGNLFVNLCRKKTSRYQKLCNQWTANQTTSLRFK